MDNIDFNMCALRFHIIMENVFVTCNLPLSFIVRYNFNNTVLQTYFLLTNISFYFVSAEVIFIFFR